MKGFKTVVYGVLIALLAIFGDETVQQFVNENFQAVGVFLGTGVILLRTITSSPIFKQE